MTFNNLQIGTRLWLAVGLLMIALLAMVTFAGTRQLRLQAHVERETDHIEHKLSLATQWSTLTEANLTRTYVTMISNESTVDAALQPAIAAASTRIGELSTQINALALSAQDRAALETIASTRQSMLDARKAAQDFKAAGQVDEALEAVEKSYRPAAAAYAQAQQAFVRVQGDARAALQGEVADTRRTTVLAVGALMALILVGAIVGAAGLIRSIRLPLKDAVELSARIARGDLSSRLEVTRGDEFGTLMRSLTSMNDSLGRMVAQVRASTESIGTASSEIASGNQDLSVRTEETASSLQQTASSMTQLNGTVRQSADSARQADQLASSAAEVAARGGAVVSQVVATMDEINDSSKKIADIIGVIDGIAFQTNILALNAAVEAARAGEQGRGFAVVASEVRSLAQRSADAAREIKALIGASVERVEAGSRLVTDAGRTMQEIVGSVQRVSDIIGEITAAAGEQSDGIDQVSTAVSQLDRMTQQNAALVEQSAAAAESLKDQAQRLSGVVRAFHVGDTMTATT